MRWLGHDRYYPDHRSARALLHGKPNAWAFGVLRDPFDRLVSEFHYRYPKRGVDYFRRKVRSLAGLNHNQHWCAHEILRGARWVRFDDLENGLRCLLAEAGIPAPPIALPHIREHDSNGKVDGVRPQIHFMDYYDEPSRLLIEQACAWEIDQLRTH